MKSYKVQLKLKSGASPKFYKPHPVPFVLKDSIEKVLDHLEEAGFVVKANRSYWATPIVVVHKKDGNFRRLQCCP